MTKCATDGNCNQKFEEIRKHLATKVEEINRPSSSIPFSRKSSLSREEFTFSASARNLVPYEETSDITVEISENRREALITFAPMSFLRIASSVIRLLLCAQQRSFRPKILDFARIEP